MENITQREQEVSRMASTGTLYDEYMKDSIIII